MPDAKSRDVDTRDVDDEAAEPQQTVVRMPSEEDHGPHFPSGMSAPEAALAGATAGMTDDEIAQVKGEAPPEVTAGDKAGKAGDKE